MSEPQSTGTRIKFISEVIMDHLKYTRDEGNRLYRKDLAPGDANLTEWDDGQTTLSFVCPCGCSAITQLPLHDGKSTNGWQWDGNKELPTLSPSILMATPCKWHGYLRSGQWVPA